MIISIENKNIFHKNQYPFSINIWNNKSTNFFKVNKKKGNKVFVEENLVHFFKVLELRRFFWAIEREKNSESIKERLIDFIT